MLRRGIGLACYSYVDLQADPSAEGVGGVDARHSTNGTAAPDEVGNVKPITKQIDPEPARAPDQAMTRVMDDGDDIAFVLPMVRAGSLAIIALQIGSTVLDLEIGRASCRE